MCGRYEFKLSDSSKSDTIKKQALRMNLTYKEGEIFPTDKVLCFIPFFGMINVDSKKWGINSKIINAKVETLKEKPMFSSIINNRCAVIANGFYEWKEKEKYLIKCDDEYIYLAALYNENGELVIITKESEGGMKDIHERMPIIMSQREMLRYLGGLNDFYSPKKLDIHKVN